MMAKFRQLSSGLTIAPVLTLPPPVLSQPSIMSYPLIPAPLGPVPSPVIRPHPKELHRKHSRYHSADHHIQRLPMADEKSRKRQSKPREKPITTEDVVRTYTGLDRTIAEEFIEICDRNTSMCSDTSCQSSCQSSNGSHSGCTACTSVCNTSSDATSRDEKL